MDASSENDPDASAVTTDGTDTVDTTNVDPSTDTDATDTTDTPSDSSDATTDSSDATTDLTDPDPTGTGSTDTMSSETDVATTDDVPDSGPGDGAIDPPEGMVIVSNFDMDDPTGFRDGSSTFAAMSIDRADSIGTLVLPFTGASQQGAWSFNFTGDYCGYELVARIRLVSGFNVDETAPGRVQLRAWNSGWTNFSGSYDPLNGVGEESQLGQWVEYSFDLDEQATAANAAFDSSDLNSVGISFITPNSGTFEEATIELDWIGLMPKPGGCPDGTTTDDLTDVTTDDTTSVDTTSVDTTDLADGGTPNVIIVSELDAVDGFAGYTNITAHTPVLTAVDSVGALDVPFTGGNYQQSSWNFDGFTAPAEGLCGYNLTARVRLDSGFNAAGAATGGVQLRAWSDNWATTLQNWTNLDAATQTGEWIEYTLDLDAEDPPAFDPMAVNAVGIAFISGGEASAEYTPATFSIDWIRLEEKVAGEGGCLTDEVDGGVDSGTDTGTPGDLDGGAADVDASLDSGGGMIDEDADVIDEDADVIDEDADVTGNEDAGTDGAVEEPEVGTDPPEGTIVIANFDPLTGFPGGTSTWDPLTVNAENSIARFELPFSTSGQQAAWSWGLSPAQDACGYNLVARVKLESGFNVDASGAGAVQLMNFAPGWANYQDNWLTLDATAHTGEWRLYTYDMDTSPNVDAVGSVSLAFTSGGTDAVYEPAVILVDWIGFVPKEGGCVE